MSLHRMDIFTQAYSNEVMVPIDKHRGYYLLF